MTADTGAQKILSNFTLQDHGVQILYIYSDRLVVHVSSDIEPVQKARPAAYLSWQNNSLDS